MNEQVINYFEFIRKIINRILHTVNSHLRQGKLSSIEYRMKQLTDILPANIFEDRMEFFHPWIDLLEKCTNWIHALSETYPINLSIKEDQLYIRIDKIHIVVNHWEEIMIAYEIFVLEEYSYFTNDNIIVIDFGMNIGLASLYFSKSDNVEKIYAYEPFFPTFENAIHNLKLNPGLAKKIQPHSYGVGANSMSIERPYSYSRKGCMGHVVNNTNLNIPELIYDRIEKINIKPASQEIMRIRNAHPYSNIILKIDIEGGEFEVVKDLVDSGSINEVNAIFMEWHYKNPNYLINNLMDAGFAVHLKNYTSKLHGMIYAFRKSK